MLKVLKFLIMLVLFFVCISCSSGIELKITNNGDKSINNVRIIFTGGNIGLEKIKPKKNKELTIRASGASEVTIEYEDFENNRFKCKVDVYIDKRTSGTMDIDIDKPGKVSFKFIENLFPYGDSVIQDKAKCNCKKAKERK